MALSVMMNPIPNIENKNSLLEASTMDNEVEQIPEDDLETADMIVFRPLFSYRGSSLRRMYYQNGFRG